MSLVKSSLYIVSATLVRALNGLIVLKILALHTIPAEFGQLSQIMGVIAFTGMLAAGGISNGLTRQLAANLNAADQYRWLGAAFKIYMVTSAAIAIFLIVASGYLARWLVADAGYALVFVCLAAGQAIVGAANLAQSIAAARADYLFILRISTIGAVAGALVVGAGVWFGGVIGGAIALVINAAFPGLAAIIIKRHSLSLLVGRVGEGVAHGDVVTLLKYASVALIGAVSLSLSQIASRNLVGQSLGWDAVGLWQIVVRISDVYMQLISVLVMGYVLPRLAKYSNFRSMHSPFLRACGAIGGIFIVCAVAVYLARNMIIPLLFSTTYLPATELLPLQLIGDLFRVIAVFLSVALMARGLTKMSMVYEASQGILTFVLTATLLGYTGFAAPLQAYCLTYAILLLWLAYVYIKCLRKE